MRIKFLAAFLVLIALLAGCQGKPKTENAITEDPSAKKEITDVNNFQNAYKDWTSRLIKVADSTNQAYISWSSGQINKDEFAARTRELYKETKRLKTEISYNTTFNLSEDDKKLADYDLITSSYNKALKQMNDFLDFLPTLDEEQIKTSYNYTNRIVNDETDKVKRHLKM